MLGRLLGWYTIQFRGLLPPDGISLYIQVLHSMLAALLRSTPSVGVSHTLQRSTMNGITEPSQRVPSIFGWVAITLRVGPHF